MFNIKKCTLLVLLCSTLASSTPNATHPPLSLARAILVTSTGFMAGSTIYFAQKSMRAYNKYKEILSPLTNPNRDKGDAQPHKIKARSALLTASFFGIFTVAGLFGIYKTADSK